MGCVKRAANLPELSVEQFAALVAECSTFPEQAAAVRTRYGVPDEATFAAFATNEYAIADSAIQTEFSP